MTASVKERSRASLRRQRAWELNVKGVNQYKIAEELGVTPARVCQLIKQAAAEHPVVALDLNQRIALSEARWQGSEDELYAAITEQQRDGRITHEVVRHPDGSETVTTTKVHGVDPALLRALSTHHDRRARQLNNQLAPDTAVQQVNVNLVKDFLGQADTPAKRLSAAEWNEGAVDV
jgi:predicted transcriptional regulator